MGRRRTPWPHAEGRGGDLDPTPAGITPPPGVLPGWDWTPPGGLVADAARLPWWVRVWRRVPLVDRYAHAWMWHHGGWALPPASPPGGRGDPSGDRQPRRPLGTPPSPAQTRLRR